MVASQIPVEGSSWQHAPYIHILHGSSFMMWFAALTILMQFWIPISEYIDIQHLSSHIIEILPFLLKLCCHCHLRCHSFPSWWRGYWQEIYIYLKCASCNLPNHLCIATIMMIETAFTRDFTVNANAILFCQGLKNGLELAKNLSLNFWSLGRNIFAL